MKLLIVAATKSEVEILVSRLKFISIDTNNVSRFSSEKCIVDILITSVGMVATAFELGRRLQNNIYDLILNVGICGAINKQLSIGEVVNVTTDCIYELGAEDGDKFLKFEELNLPGKNKFENILESKNEIIRSLRKVSGITVNTVHGNDTSISKIESRIKSDVETMEGAAFMYAMENQATPYFQIRSISNYVERRDRSKWNILLAIKNLNEELLNIIHSL
ncbi:MAG: futalosine hydrolase [Bacteroidetes bacterium]|nr:futalosine hydrolase [Bacteroidota bacterium]